MLHIKPIVSSLLRSKSGPLLLLLQMILSVAIVANAAFIIHQRLDLMSRDSGIVESEVFSFNVYNFDPALDLRQQSQVDRVILRNLNGVMAVAPTNMVPLSGSGWMDVFLDRPVSDDAKSTPGFALYMGDEHLLQTLGLELIDGRNIRPEEVRHEINQTGQVAIVSAPLAKAHWGDESPVGKVVYSGDVAVTIVGVVDKLQGAWVDHRHFEYSVIQSIDYGGADSISTYLVRAKAGDMARLEDDIRAALRAENPNRVINEFTSLTEHRNSSYSHHALMVGVLTLMVVLLLAITALGLAGMVMFNIERRTKQIGTRRALGARKRDVVGHFLVENYLLCLLGGVIGGLLAVQLGQQLMTLYSLPMLHPAYPLATVAGLFVVTTLAVLLPARRAATISPAIATRSA